MQPQSKTHYNRTCLRGRAIARRGGNGGGGVKNCCTFLISVRRLEDSLHAGSREAAGDVLEKGLAAACEKTVLQPFDTIKTVQQFSTAQQLNPGAVAALPR